MTRLTWTDELRLNQPLMDQTHEEFVALLGAARRAVDDGLTHDALAIFERLIDHTGVHFAREERWMRAIGLEGESPHAQQHAAVLRVMRDVVRAARAQSSCAPLAFAIDELAQWFPLHARMMDGDLALCMARAGFVPDDDPDDAEPG